MADELKKEEPPAVTKTAVTKAAVAPASDIKIKAPSLQDGLDHINAVRANMQKYEGQFNMNPFNWLRDNGVDKIEKRLKQGDTTAIADALKLSVTAEPKTKSTTVNTNKPRN
jgi:hypothetical protein